MDIKFYQLAEVKEVLFTGCKDCVQPTINGTAILDENKFALCGYCKNDTMFTLKKKA